MGVYIYTMRKKTVNVVIGHATVKANLFLFAYKDHWIFDLGKEHARRKFRENNAHRIGQEAFNSKRSGYVIDGDPDIGFHGARVYNNVTNGIWVDTGKFPGTLIGYAHLEGKKLVMRPESPWWTCKVYDKDGGQFVSSEVREIVQPDGKLVTERRPIVTQTDVLVS